MNEKEKEQFIKLIDDLKELRLRKSADYGNSWKIFGLLGVVWQINSKYIRMQNLLDHGRDPRNEPLRDTLIDLANYCLMGVQLIDSGQTESKMKELLRQNDNILLYKTKDDNFTQR